jgi:hypothetical protein
MAIDSAAKRRNVGRLLSPSLFLGLAASGVVGTQQRVNLGRGYIGFSYSPPVEATTPFVRVTYTSKQERVFVSGSAGNIWKIKQTSR